MKCEIITYSLKSDTSGRAFKSAFKFWLNPKEVLQATPVLLHTPEFILGHFKYDKESGLCILREDKPILYVGESGIEQFLQDLEKDWEKYGRMTADLNDEQLSELKTFGEQYSSARESLIQKVKEYELKK